MTISGATLVENYNKILDYSVATTQAISEGDILMLMDNRTAIRPTASEGLMCAGIAAADKDSTDNAVNVGVHQDVVANVYINNAATTGDMVIISSGNVCKATGDMDTVSAGAILGILFLCRNHLMSHKF